MSVVSEGAKQTTKGTQSTNVSAKELGRLAEKLHHAVADFSHSGGPRRSA